MVNKKYAHLIKGIPAEHQKPGPPKKTKYGDRITDMPVMVETFDNLPAAIAIGRLIERPTQHTSHRTSAYFLPSF